VQLVFNDLPDQAELKLTIAQYLTEPGDVSIQGVGVTPDIELDPMTVDDKEMDLTVDAGAILHERDLSRSLSNARAREHVFAIWAHGGPKGCLGGDLAAGWRDVV